MERLLTPLPLWSGTDAQLGVPVLVLPAGTVAAPVPDATDAGTDGSAPVDVAIIPILVHRIEVLEQSVTALHHAVRTVEEARQQQALQFSAALAHSAETQHVQAEQIAQLRTAVARLEARTLSARLSRLYAALRAYWRN